MKKFLLVTLLLVFVLSLVGCTGLKQKTCDHEYEDTVVVPTCLVEGYTEHVCKKCEYSYTDATTEKTHHRFNGGTCLNCDSAEIIENITPDTEWYSEDAEIFRLSTKEQLAGLAALVNEGNSFSGKKVYLDADIDLEYYEWIPIGTAEAPFSGSFDGDGYTVKGLKISASTDDIGLFGAVYGSVSNVNIEHATVYAKNDSQQVSIACGYSTNELTNITVSGYIDAVKSDYVGAVVGYGSAKVEHSTSTAIINGRDYVGGIAGYLDLYAATLSKLTYSGTVTGNNYVGGIVGSIIGYDSVQTDVINVNGEVKGTQQVGGVFGCANATIGSEIYGAKVSARVEADYYVGGIVGKTETFAVDSCSNEGSEIIANFYLTDGDYFLAFLGGYVGAGYSVNNCVNNVNITYNSRGRCVGGVAGCVINAITNCTNNGDILAADAIEVGGVVGAIQMNYYFNIVHSGLSNTGNVTGKEAVGGVIGTIYQNISYCGESSVRLDNSNNSGNVKGEANVGGIVGWTHLQNNCGHWWGTDNSCLVATNLSNSGSVSGITAVGEMFGHFYSDGGSGINSYSVTGKITVNGEVLEGAYDVGENTNLALEGRDGPVVEEEPQTAE